MLSLTPPQSSHPAPVPTKASPPTPHPKAFWSFYCFLLAFKSPWHDLNLTPGLICNSFTPKQPFPQPCWASFLPLVLSLLFPRQDTCAWLSPCPLRASSNCLLEALQHIEVLVNRFLKSMYVHSQTQKQEGKSSGPRNNRGLWEKSGEGKWNGIFWEVEFTAGC